MQGCSGVRCASLLLWIWNREDPLFFIGEAAVGTRDEHQHVSKGVPADLGFLAELPTSQKNERKYFRRQETVPLWAIVHAAAA